MILHSRPRLASVLLGSAIVMAIPGVVGPAAAEVAGDGGSAPTTSTVVAPEPAVAAAQPAAGTVVVTPGDDLADGQTITVGWSGFPADKGIVATQCNTVSVTAVAQCDITTYRTGTSDSSGAGTLQFTVHTGTVGDGVCDDAADNDCTIYVSDAPDQTTVGYDAISFGAARSATAAPSSESVSTGASIAGEADTAGVLSQGLTGLGAPSIAGRLSAQPAAGTVVVTPGEGLADGQAVTVRWSGFPANKGIVATQCNRVSVTAVAQCNITTYKTGTSDSSGGGSLRFTVHTGTVGDGVCDDGANNDCTIYVSDTPDQTTVGYDTLSFGAPQSTATTATPSSGSGSTGDPTPADTAGAESPTADHLADTGAASTIALVVTGAVLVLLGATGVGTSRRWIASLARRHSI